MESYWMINYAKYISNSWIALQLTWTLSHYQLFTRYRIRIICHIFVRHSLKLYSFINVTMIAMIIWCRISMVDFERLRATKWAILPKGQYAIYAPSAHKLMPILFAFKSSKSNLDILHHIIIAIIMSLMIECDFIQCLAKIWHIKFWCGIL